MRSISCWERFDGALDSSGSAEIYAGRRDDTRGASDGAAADRFGIVQKMDFYTPEELQTIVLRTAEF